MTSAAGPCPRSASPVASAARLERRLDGRQAHRRDRDVARHRSGNRRAARRRRCRRGRDRLARRRRDARAGWPALHRLPRRRLEPRRRLPGVRRDRRRVRTTAVGPGLRRGDRARGRLPRYDPRGVRRGDGRQRPRPVPVRPAGRPPHARRRRRPDRQHRLDRQRPVPGRSSRSTAPRRARSCSSRATWRTSWRGSASP